MCTKAETAEVLHEEFWKKDGIRDQLISELHRAIDARVGRWLLAGGLVLLFTIAGAWFTLKNDVSRNTEKISNALTTDQAALVVQRLETLEKTIQNQNDVIEKLDNRLRAKGI